jgi:penicillin-insensitive murein DD-endopeptidase
MTRWLRRAAAVLGCAAPLVAASQTLVSPLHIVGGGAGCVAGAVELPGQGPGWETIRQASSTFWGAPGTVAGVELLARRARAAGLPTLYINDLSRPRGGPLTGLHASHQTGLDADVWLDITPKLPLTAAERERIAPQSLVAPDGREVDPAVWQPGHATLIRLATELPGVDRVLVNAAIKAELCHEVGPEAAWLHKVRPWWGHSAHMHIHFACPPGQGDCRDLPPIPAGTGCDASLQWWFDQLGKPAPPVTPAHPPPLPAACRAILGEE